MQNKKEAFDYEALKKKTLKQFRSGKDLFSKGGAFAHRYHPKAHVHYEYHRGLSSANPQNNQN